MSNKAKEEQNPKEGARECLDEEIKVKYHDVEDMILKEEIIDGN